MTEFVTDRHLGGYVKNGDPATFYPELWTWLVAEYQVGSVIDVGCGEGHAVEFFDSLRCEAFGVDGVAQPRKGVAQWDYTNGPFVRRRFVMDEETQVMGSEPIRYDLCWSCEFVEHVEERYVGNFLATFACAETVLMTHAEPGQPGYHHVNCQPAEYWKGALVAIGYEHDETLTAATRELARSNNDPNNHYVRSGLAFRRYE